MKRHRCVFVRYDFLPWSRVCFIWHCFIFCILSSQNFREIWWRAALSYVYLCTLEKESKLRNYDKSYILVYVFKCIVWEKREMQLEQQAKHDKLFININRLRQWSAETMFRKKNLFFKNIIYLVVNYYSWYPWCYLFPRCNYVIFKSAIIGGKNHNNKRIQA